MQKLHTWEQVYADADKGDPYAEIVHRFRVPGGWLYTHNIVRQNWFRRDHIATVFVPDPDGDKE